MNVTQQFSTLINPASQRSAGRLEIDQRKKSPQGDEKETKISIQVETVEIFALSALVVSIGAVIVAIAMIFGMMFNVIPVNALTVGILAFSGVGTTISGIARAQWNKLKKDEAQAG